MQGPTESLFKKDFEENQMTDCFLKNLMNISRDSVPDRVFIQARNCFIDYLACTLAGAKEFYAKDLAYIDSLNSDNGNSTVIGFERKCSLQTAALVNGMNSHIMELDDGHRKGAVHVGGTIFSALFPVAEQENLSIQDFLYGAIIGYEVTIRLACAVQPGNKLRGYHATGTCGTVGATMAIAAALHFDFDQMKSAFSAAVTSAAGVLEMQEDNADMKPLNVGRAAMDAIAAAYLGKARFKAPVDALGGKRGFLKVMTDEPRTSFLKDFDSNSFGIMSIYNKPYASCRHTHSAIDATITIRKKNNLNFKSISSILVETYKLAIAGHDHTKIPGISSAKMSIPYSVAIALITGNAGLDAFSEKYVTDKDVLDLTSKVKVIEKEDLSALCPQKRASIVTVNANGEQFTERSDYPKGEPENPLTEEEFKQKVFSLLKYTGKDYKSINNIWNIVLNNSWNFNELLNLIHV